MQTCVAVDGAVANSIMDFLTKPTKHRPISGRFYIQLSTDGAERTNLMTFLVTFVSWRQSGEAVRHLVVPFQTIS